MTKKQFRRKTMQLKRNFDKLAKEQGRKTSKSSDRFAIPNWGIVIKGGSHDGEILTSYDQCWDMLKDALGKTSLFEGIE